MHEKWGMLFEGVISRRGVFYYRWLVLGIPIALLLPVVFFPLLRSLPAATRRAVVIAGAVYVLGAVGMEAISATVHWTYGVKAAWFPAMTTIEEGMEMVGVALFVVALLRYVEVPGHHESAKVRAQLRARP
jgi:hypothetical protein